MSRPQTVSENLKMDKEEALRKIRSLEVFPDTLEHPNSTIENVEIFAKCNTGK